MPAMYGKTGIPSNKVTVMSMRTRHLPGMPVAPIFGTEDGLNKGRAENIGAMKKNKKTVGQFPKWLAYSVAFGETFR